MRTLSTVSLLLCVFAVAPVYANDDEQRYDRAVRYLLAQQHENGGFAEMRGTKGEVGITCLVARALAEVPERLRKETQPVLDKATAFILATQQEDGSFLQKRSGIPTYRTSVAIMALAAIDRKKHAKAIERAAAWLKGSQNDDEKGIAKEDVRYGGFSYGKARKGGRAGADLSNTHMALAALRDAGVPETDPVFQRALTFLRRCQNDSEVNDAKGFKPKNDGGFVYNPVPGRRSADQGLPSYAGMTYAGLLSLAYTGAGDEDPSVKSALRWISKHYTLDRNEGLGVGGSRESDQAGLYYYYYVFAKCLKARGKPTVATEGGARSWARDLFDALAARQREDGSFVNPEGTWWEHQPVLVTAYCVSAMNWARPHLEDEKK